MSQRSSLKEMDRPQHISGVQEVLPEVGADNFGRRVAGDALAGVIKQGDTPVSVESEH